ncbi:hypothetical protein ACWEKT_35905 [Nocardia takedensis]
MAKAVQDPATGKSAGMSQKDFVKKRLDRTRDRLFAYGVPRADRDALFAQAAATSASRSRPRDWAEEMGMIGARDIARSRNETMLLGADEFDDQPLKGQSWKRRGANAFDVVSVSEDGKRLVVYEAKGGSGSKLSKLLKTRRVRDPERPGRKVRAEQGSREYLQDMLQSDTALHEKLADHPELLAAVRAGTVDVEYHLVQGTTKGAFQHKQFDIGPTPIGLPGSPSPPGFRPRRPSPMPTGKAAGGRMRRFGASLAIVGALTGAAGAASMFGGAPNASAAVVHQASGQAGADPALLAAHSAATQDAADKTRALGTAAQGMSGASQNVKDALSATSGESSKLTSIVTRVAGVQTIASTVLTVLAVAQQAFNLIMRANPFGAIATAITLAIVGIVLLIENWGTVEQAFQWVLDKVLRPVGEWFSTIWRDHVVPIFRTVVSAINGIFQGIADVFHGLWETAVDAFKGVLRFAADLLDHGPDFLVGAAVRRIRQFTDPEKKADGGLIGESSGPRGGLVPTVVAGGGLLMNTVSTVQDTALSKSVAAVSRFAGGGLVTEPMLVRATAFDALAAQVASVAELAAGGMVGSFSAALPSPPGAALGSGSTVSRTGKSASSRARSAAGAKSYASLNKTITQDKMTAFGGAHATESDVLSILRGAMTGTRRAFAEGGFIDGENPSAVHLAAGGDVPNVFGDLVPVRLSAGEFVVPGEVAAGYRSLLEAINQDAHAVANMFSPNVIPTGAPPGGGRGRKRVDRSIRLELSRPDVDAQFHTAAASRSQRALTYTSRWH